MKNLHVILDIDQTLIDSIPNNLIKGLNLRVPQYYCSENNLAIWTRKNLDKFLNYLDKNVKYISIWTNGSRGWLNYIVDNILNKYINRRRFKYLLSNESSDYIMYENNHLLIKDLNKLANKQLIDLKNTILIDDNYHNCILNKNNTIPLKKFNIKLENTELKRGDAFLYIIQVLEILKKSNNIAETLRKVYAEMNNYDNLFG